MPRKQEITFYIAEATENVNRFFKTLFMKNADEGTILYYENQLRQNQYLRRDRHPILSRIMNMITGKRTLSEKEYHNKRSELTKEIENIDVNDSPRVQELREKITQ